jgi:hypothetical protein
MSDLNQLCAPSGCIRRDLTSDPIPGGGLEQRFRSFEIVVADTVSPYGTLTVIMSDGNEVILDYLETGYEHVGQFVSIVSSSGIDILRLWL